ncbi:hypothetical protein Tco_0448720 [Tanacetum coccineum]
MKEHVEIVPEEEVAIDAIPLATNPPCIVDFKIYKEEKKDYFQIIRADGSSKLFLTFSAMFGSFDKEDLETLWKLVQARYKSKKPVEDLEVILCWDLKVMFEPETAYEVWRNLLGNKVKIWKLIDSCGVHYVRFKNMHIYMLVESRYPLKPSTIQDMFNKKLQADQWNEICYQLSQTSHKIAQG